MQLAFFRKSVLWLMLGAGIMMFSSGVQGEEPDQGPERIVSLAPNATEILYTLGLGNRVVGVTRYCDYPTSATQKTKVGGYFDPSYETILTLKPDLVILVDSHDEAMERLESLGLKTLTIPHKTLDDIRQAVEILARRCGADEKARDLLEKMEQKERAIRQAVEGKKRPKVLICIGRDTKSKTLEGMYVAGQDGFYNRLIEAAGGVNAYRQNTPFPQLSAESVIQLNPDVIIDLVSHFNPETNPTSKIEKQWSQLKTVRAVQEGRVHAIVSEYALRPGPRYVLFLEELARLLHPEALKVKGHQR